MNSSLWSADRNTHIKIVAVSLVAAIAVMAVGISARISDPGAVTARIHADGPVIKAGKPATFTANDTSTIR
jgi:hypothetical protein